MITNKKYISGFKFSQKLRGHYFLFRYLPVTVQYLPDSQERFRACQDDCYTAEEAV